MKRRSRTLEEPVASSSDATISEMTPELLHCKAQIHILRTAFANQLKQYLLTHGTLKRLSDITGVTTSSLYKYSRGMHEPQVSQAIVIASAIGLSIEEMVGLKSKEIQHYSIVFSNTAPEQYVKVLFPPLQDVEKKGGADMYYYNGQTPSILTCPLNVMPTLSSILDIPACFIHDSDGALKQRKDALMTERIRIVDILSRNWIDKLVQKQPNNISEIKKGLQDWLNNLVFLLQDSISRSMRYSLVVSDMEVSGSFRLWRDELVVFLPGQGLIQCQNRDIITDFQDRLQDMYNTSVSNPQEVLRIVQTWLAQLDRW